MKNYVFLALISSSAFGHEVQHQSQFFKDEVAKNPMIQQVLVWCSLIGLDDEALCKEEMYGVGSELNSIRIDAAAKCVEKSGLQYKVAFDEFFKAGVSKNNGFVGHDVSPVGRHLVPLKDPKEGPNAKEHYYYHTAVQREESARKMGDVYVAKIKADYEGKSSTSIVSGSGTVEGGMPGLSASATAGVETSITKGPLTVEQIQAERAKGEAYGRAHPETSGVEPGGICYVGGDCLELTKKFPESQLQSEVTRDVVAEAVAAANPKPAGPVAEPVEIAPDPFAPFTSGTATGGMPTGLESPKSDSSTSPTVGSNEDDKTTPIHTEAFARNINDCMNREEAKLLQAQGSTTVDPDTQTAEERKTAAEERLKNGYCDIFVFGQAFCQKHKNEQASREAEGADENVKSAKERAMENFQRHGICSPMILGFAYCNNAKALLDMDKDNPAEEAVGGHVSDGPTVPDSSTDPESAAPSPWIPRGGRGNPVLVDPNSIHP